MNTTGKGPSKGDEIPQKEKKTSKQKETTNNHQKKQQANVFLK